MKAPLPAAAQRGQKIPPEDLFNLLVDTFYATGYVDMDTIYTLGNTKLVRQFKRKTKSHVI